MGSPPDWENVPDEFKADLALRTNAGSVFFDSGKSDYNNKESPLSVRQSNPRLAMEQQPIEVFFSYSREDKPLRDKLEIHLSSLKRQGVITSWHDRQILAGSEWKEEIDHHIQTADIILLLISPNFVNSQYCYEIELPDAMARHEAGSAYVVPILLRPVAGWKNLPFAKLQLYPTGGLPVTKWPDEDDAFVDITEGIAAAVEALLQQRQQARAEFDEWLVRSPLPLPPESQPELEQWQKRTHFSDSEISEKISAIAAQRQAQAQRAEQQQREQADRIRQEQERLERERQEAEQARLAAAREQEERRKAEQARQELERLLAEQRKRSLAEQERKEQERLKAEQLQQQQESEARRKPQPLTIDLTRRKFLGLSSDRIPLDLIPIPGGKFWMGSPDGEGSDSEKPRHEVAIAPFYMSKYPITQAQYQAVMDQNLSSFKGENRPVEGVTWWDAIAFCEALSKLGDRQFTLPSEGVTEI